MRRLVSSAAALAADRAAELNFGYPPLLLMEEAGIRLQDELERWEAKGAWGAGPVAYLVGSGNNGGDAWVMARQAWLRGRRALVVVEVFAPSSESARRQAQWGRQIGLPVLTWPSAEAQKALSEAALWVDGLWGTGLKEPLRADRAAVLADLEGLRRGAARRCLAVDLPSGLWAQRTEAEPVLTAHWTFSAGPLKDFLYFPAHRELGGRLVEVPLAFPQPAESRSLLWEQDDLAHLLPPVAAAAHKGSRGHVALVGAAAGMTGALVLAARSAAAAGAGLISLGVDEALTATIAPQVPAFQVRTFDDLFARASRFDALVVGPGWGRESNRSELLERLWATELPLVLDADGLAAWGALGRPRRSATTVFTPHPGEFLRLGAGAATVEHAAALAREAGVVVVLKGAVTWVLAPDGRRGAWDGEQPALGTGGSGDCLAGVVGALLAVGLEGFEAASAAVVLHGVAGAQLANAEGWFTADRLPEALARASLACRTAPRPL